jgi:ankyrin repeat protein
MDSLIQAAYKGNLNRVKELLNQGVNVNGLNGGYIPLHTAIVRDHLPVVKLLLNRGAKVNALDRYGRQPIHRAAEFDRLNIVKELLNRGANINARDRKGRTPIHYAAIIKPRSLINVIKELINRGANVTNVLKSNDVSANTKNAIREYEQLRVNRAKAHTRSRAPLENLVKYVFHPSRVKIPNNIAETLKKENNRRRKNLKNENNMIKKNPELVGTMKIPHWIKS